MERRSNVVAFPIDMEDSATTHAKAEPSFVLLLNVSDHEALRYCRAHNWMTEYDGDMYCLLTEVAE